VNLSCVIAFAVMAAAGIVQLTESDREPSPLGRWVRFAIGWILSIVGLSFAMIFALKRL